MKKQKRKNKSENESMNKSVKKNRPSSDALSQKFEMGVDILREAFVKLKQQHKSAFKSSQNHSKCKETIVSLENKLIHAHSSIEKLKRQLSKEQEKSKSLDRRNRELITKYREGEVFRENLFRMIQRQESHFKSSMFSEPYAGSSIALNERDSIRKLKSENIKRKRMLLPEPHVDSDMNEIDESRKNMSPPSDTSSQGNEDIDLTNLRKAIQKKNDQLPATSTSPIISPIMTRHKKSSRKLSNKDYEIYGKDNSKDLEIVESIQHQKPDDMGEVVDLKIDLDSDYGESEDDESDSIDDGEEKDLTRKMSTPVDLSSLYSSVSMDSPPPKKRNSEIRYEAESRSNNMETLGVRNSITEAEELYAKVKRKLSTSQFRLFADNIKKLNNEELSQEQTLSNIRKIFGAKYFDVYVELERLVKNKE